ncbi:unnamed protein product [Closterium sp. NIES-53]
MMHRQRTAVEAWVHQLQLEGSSTNGGIAPPAARADKQRLDVSATESASVMVPFTVANAAIRKNVAESVQGYESPARLAAQELPELLERSAEAARFAQLQILSAAEERSFSAANGAVASGKSPLPASRSVMPRDAAFSVSGNPVAAASHNVAVTSSNCRTPVSLVSSPNSPPEMLPFLLVRTSPFRLSGEMALAARCADSRRTMSLPGENCILASAMVDLEEEALVQELLRSDSRGAQTGMLVDGGGLDGSGSAAAAGVEASAGVFSDGGNPVLGASNSSGDMAGGSQAQQTSLVRQQLGSPTMGDWRPRTRTRFDAEAKERGVIKPRSMRERKRRDKISEGLQQLRRMLPAGAVGPQIDTATMIEVAISHITHLQSQVNRMESALLVQSLMEQRENQQYPRSEFNFDAKNM